MLVYPRLPGRLDLGVARLAGAGLGNCFFSYFHAFRLSVEQGAQLVAPTWRAVRIGPLLRGERTRRHYARELRPHPDEVVGLRRLWLLAGLTARRGWPDATGGRPTLTVVDPVRFTFEGLHEHRPAVRDRLLAIMRRPPEQAIWGTGGYGAAHIRLGDFGTAQPGELESGQRDNLRIPLDWYARVIALVRRANPGLAIRLYSDGRAEDLAELLSLDGVTLHAEPGDVDDLLALAGANILIGSESTFSRWAAFLGDMPSIWFRSAKMRERPGGNDTPITYLAGDETTLPAAFVATGQGDKAPPRREERKC